MTAVDTIAVVDSVGAGSVGARYSRRLRVESALDVAAILAPHRRGAGDPCQQRDETGALWRTWRTPDGAVSLRIAVDPGAGEIDVQAFGPGASYAVETVPALLGLDDDPDGFADLELPRGRLADVRAASKGLRLSRSGQVFEALVAAILEQLVTGTEAWRSWRQLVGRFGTPAPGPAPAGMAVCPSPADILSIPDWEWHRAGLDGRRRRTVLGVAAIGRRIESFGVLGVDEVAAKLITLPGIGPWTVAETLQRSHGAPDQVSVGDLHLPNLVGFVLTGRPRTDDAGMLELLEPWRANRQRVVRLIERTGASAPRYGPRMAPRDNRRI
jgi:3-methyladenine DNA glycosylase/8-oxoguanine DNA glycosylase